jgi:hypothetical protein
VLTLDQEGRSPVLGLGALINEWLVSAQQHQAFADHYAHGIPPNRGDHARLLGLGEQARMITATTEDGND